MSENLRQTNKLCSKIYTQSINKKLILLKKSAIYLNPKIDLMPTDN